MIKSSLLQASNNSATYTSNEPITVNTANHYGHIVYSWNTRFVTLLNAFFLGTPLVFLTPQSLSLLDKYVAYANGTLSTTDVDYDMILQYNNYLATLQ